jgi:hypothetical protein
VSSGARATSIPCLCMSSSTPADGTQMYCSATTAGVVQQQHAGVALFVGVFVGSVLFGLAVGFVAALLFRTAWFRSHDADLVATGLLVRRMHLNAPTLCAAHTLSAVCCVPVFWENSMPSQHSHLSCQLCGATSPPRRLHLLLCPTLGLRRRTCPASAPSYSVRWCALQQHKHAAA